MYQDNIRVYQNEIAICCDTPEETTNLALLIIDAMKLSGLTTNMEKSFMSPTEAKPLLGALWKPNLFIQKQEQENLQKLQSNWDTWKQARTLHSLRKFKGKLASLANFPTAQLSAAIQNNASEQEIETLLKKITTTAPSGWSTLKKAMFEVKLSILKE
eukprot:GHVP01070526.1.p1 GENE.GHVP01070526.1~~GHVP01070526.1.p1  ORF type:complete len:158 (+),score=24.42 GHVP01070526.1:204-677(+)